MGGRDDSCAFSSARSIRSARRLWLVPGRQEGPRGRRAAGDQDRDEDDRARKTPRHRRRRRAVLRSREARWWLGWSSLKAPCARRVRDADREIMRHRRSTTHVALPEGRWGMQGSSMPRLAWWSPCRQALSRSCRVNGDSSRRRTDMLKRIFALASGTALTGLLTAVAAAGCSSDEPKA